MIILIEALKGGMAELRDCPDLPSRLSTAARHARLIAEELAGQVVLIPFALRALSERRRAKRDGRLVEGVRYGPRERQVADIWLPPPPPPPRAAGDAEEKKNRKEERRPPAIAVLFHGGTWTAGDKWNVGPCCLALADRCRCVVVAPNYSVYSAKEGLGISSCVEDAVDAVRWAGTPAAAAAATPAAAAEEEEEKETAAAAASPPPSRSHGGDPTRLAVLGHSAGAHLAVAAAMVLAAEREMEEDEEEDKDGGEEKRRSRRPRRHRHSLPSAVVSIAGPFDPPSHFEHEAKRGVHRLSTMARAAATPRGFALEAAERMMMSKGARGRSSSSSSSPSSVFNAAPELHRASLAALSPLACVAPEASLAGLRPSAGPLAGVAKAAARKKGRRAKGREEEGKKKTRFLFISSAADAVVPPDSSRALHAALEAAGRVESRHVEYPAAGDRPVGHADFVVRSWRGGEAAGRGGEKMSAASAAPWAAEVEAVVSSL